MLTPQVLALVYDRSDTDRRRGNLDAAAAFDAWIASPVSAVRWCVRRGTILGYEPGYPLGCYQAPITARLPLR